MDDAKSCVAMFLEFIWHILTDIATADTTLFFVTGPLLYISHAHPVMCYTFNFSHRHTAFVMTACIWKVFHNFLFVFSLRTHRRTHTSSCFISLPVLHPYFLFISCSTIDLVMYCNDCKKIRVRAEKSVECPLGKCLLNAHQLKKMILKVYLNVFFPFFERVGVRTPPTFFSLHFALHADVIVWQSDERSSFFVSAFA